MELELLEKARNGDEESFKAMVLFLKNDLYRIAKSRLNNDEDAQDVIQNTMILVYKNIKHLRNIQAFKIWIVRILINECNKCYKKKKKNNEISENEIIEIGSDSSLDEANNKMTFYQRLDILNEKEKNVIILFYGNQYACQEISKILHMNENTVKSHLRRAKKKLEESYCKGD